MPSFAALLRGINVGKAKRVPMATLRELLAGLGYRDVRILLNSGNAVFHSRRTSTSAHAEAIAESISDALSIDVPVIVKSAAQFAGIVAGNPFARPDIDAARLLVVYTQDAAALDGLSALAPLVKPPEEFSIGAEAAYLHCAAGILESAAGAALLGKLAKSATTRNWATSLKLQALLAGDA